MKRNSSSCLELEGLEGLEDGGHEGEFDDGAGGGTAIGAMRRYAMLSSRRSLGLCLCSLAVSLPRCLFLCAPSSM